MLSKEEIEKVNKILSCDNCPTSYACEGCDITWTDKQLLKKYIEQLEEKEKRLKNKLEKDVVNITKTLQDGKHCDDYSRCRLKAYRTKTKEILGIIGEKYE